VAPDRLCDQEGRDGVVVSSEYSLKQKLQGLLCFRLLLAIIFLVLTILVQSRREGDLLSAHLQPLYFLSCILFAFTIVASFSLREARNLTAFAYVQLLFDVGAVSFLIYLSGGVDSPYPFLYMPVIISAALLLFRRGSLLIASVCSLAYGTLLDLQYFGWISPLQMVSGTPQLRDSGAYFHSILMAVAVFYLVAYLSGYLAEELQKSGVKLELQRKDLHQLEMLHQNIVHSMNSGLLTINAQGIIRFANRAARDILATDCANLSGSSLGTLFPDIDQESWPQQPPTSFPPASSEILARKQISYRRPTGEELCLGYTVSALQRETDEGIGWILIFQDLTGLKAMEERVQRMERVDFAGKIAAEIAHEIKNPLAAMSGAVQMLQKDLREGSREARLMHIVEREIHRINELVVDFLWLAKGARKPEKVEPVSICNVIDEMLSLLKTRQKVNSHQRMETAYECSPVVAMDPHHFRQILWNLLMNALEAMPDGGELSISVGCCGNGEPQNGAEARIDIRDTGCGIPDDIKERLFEPFFTTKRSGTGLGLSIVYQLVESAQGRLRVSSNDPRGTIFSLFFPTL
jgi:two-component system sensor histidine kinase PilS (NtrC family)